MENIPSALGKFLGIDLHTGKYYERQYFTKLSQLIGVIYSDLIIFRKSL